MKGSSMHRFSLRAFLILCLAAPQAVLAQSTPAPVTPPVQSTPPAKGKAPVQGALPALGIPYEPRGVYATINMGPTREMMQRLSAAYGSDKRSAIREVRANAASFQPAVLYTLASVLAEDYAEEAIFWYHVGRVRAVYDALRCLDKSAGGVVNLELRKLLNLELRGAMGYRRERLVPITQKAIDWDARNPRNYDHRWAALYGKVAATSAGTNPNEVTVPESEWPEILKRVHETHLKSVQEFAREKPAS
jgi:hypothetical protein